ncbi:MAG TPA: thioredoxin family protein [Azospirillaceae bacterium]|nr:thioredoxin family protein [Azospirillaceae bacterium]
MLRTLLLPALLFLPAPALAQVEAPIVSATAVSRAVPAPYDEAADARLELAAALERARTSGKRVLVEFGANWCPVCRTLGGLMAEPEVKAFLDRHFEKVLVDVGRFDRNMDILAALGVERPRSIPAVLVLEADGTVLNASDTDRLTGVLQMTPQDAVDWLAEWARPPLDAVKGEG